MKQDNLQAFCRLVRARSDENRRAIDLLHGQLLPSPTISILRQEVDSLVRVIYLLASRDPALREALLEASVSGKKWTISTAKGKLRTITDREMVELAQRLHGWTASVYRFGCAFVHLSGFHDHKARDPLRSLAKADRGAILAHLRAYHGGPDVDEATFVDVLPYLPRVFHKIADNLECYVKQLEAGEVIDAGNL